MVHKITAGLLMVKNRRVRRRNSCRRQKAREKAFWDCIGSGLLIGSIVLTLRRSCKYDTSHFVPHRKHYISMTKRSRLKCFNPLKLMQTIHKSFRTSPKTLRLYHKVQPVNSL